MPAELGQPLVASAGVQGRLPSGVGGGAHVGGLPAGRAEQGAQLGVLDSAAEDVQHLLVLQTGRQAGRGMGGLVVPAGVLVANCLNASVWG